MSKSRTALGKKLRELRNNIQANKPTKVVDSSVVDRAVEFAEEQVGMSSGAWDMVDPKDIIQAVFDFLALHERDKYDRELDCD